jgi:hypothetical protein
MALLDDARRELAEKSRGQIDTETAWKWAARAVAACQLAREAPRPELATALVCDMNYYADEAIEHAALADSTGATLQAVRAWMRQYVTR